MNGAEREAVLDEAVTAALARLTVAYDLQALDWAIHLKQLAQLHFVDCGWDVVHHQVSDCLGFSIWWSGSWWWNGHEDDGVFLAVLT